MLSLNSEDVRYSVTGAHVMSVTEAVQHEVKMCTFTNGASQSKECDRFDKQSKKLV